jgi:hypothetical protein
VSSRRPGRDGSANGREPAGERSARLCPGGASPTSGVSGGAARAGLWSEQRSHRRRAPETSGAALDIAIRFAEALDAPAGDPDLLAVRLAHAAAAVLPVDGIGLSVHGERELRTPLAASSEVAATAERLQFTAGSGPCLLCAESGLPVFAGEDLLARRWPVFHDLLVTHTPLRSVLALSLPGRLKGVGAMDLYLADPDGPTAVDVFEARCVAELVADQLDGAADWSVWTPTEAPSWSDTPDARRRGRLWMAVGMLMLALEVPAHDALALLRGYAYAADRTADDVADDLVERRLEPEHLREGESSEH